MQSALRWPNCQGQRPYQVLRFLWPHFLEFSLFPSLCLGRLFTKSLLCGLTVALPLPFVHPRCLPPWDSESITLPCCWPSGLCLHVLFLLSTITHACLALGTGERGSLCLPLLRHLLKQSPTLCFPHECLKIKNFQLPLPPTLQGVQLKGSA